MAFVWIIVVVVVLALLAASVAVRVVKQYEQGVLFRLGRVIGTRPAGLTFIIPFVDVPHRVSLRIVTRDDVSVDVSAVAYFRVLDPVRSVVAIENVGAAINQIAQTTLRTVVGQHALDETLSETDRINVKIIAAEGEAPAADALGSAADIMMAHLLALQLRNLQSLVELGVDKNTTVVFPAPLMSTIGELGEFLNRETTAAKAALSTSPSGPNGTPLLSTTT